VHHRQNKAGSISHLLYSMPLLPPDTILLLSYTADARFITSEDEIYILDDTDRKIVAILDAAPATEPD